MSCAAEFLRATAVILKWPNFDHAALQTYNLHHIHFVEFYVHVFEHICPQVLRRLQLTLLLLKKELELSKLQVKSLDEIVVVNCC